MINAIYAVKPVLIKTKQSDNNTFLVKDNRLLFQLLNFVQKSILCAKLTTCEKKNCSKLRPNRSTALSISSAQTVSQILTFV